MSFLAKIIVVIISLTTIYILIFPIYLAILFAIFLLIKTKKDQRLLRNLKSFLTIGSIVLGIIMIYFVLGDLFFTKEGLPEKGFGIAISVYIFLQLLATLWLRSYTGRQLDKIKQISPADN